MQGIDWLLHPKNKWRRFFKVLNISMAITLVFQQVKYNRLDEWQKEAMEVMSIQAEKINALERDNAQKTIESYEFNAVLQAMNESPVASWTKKVIKLPGGQQVYVMRYFNKAYVDIFLNPRGIDPSIYVGQEDYVAWDSTIVKEFTRRDSIVFATKRPYRGTITLPDSLGNMVKWNINKYPVFFDGEPIFISGIAFKADGQSK
ncbi:MAG: hypothetical protein CMI02_00960 [Oceanospirillaceae bacterium]|nr:hypothetical protein [Oceanospirillaceae bacterium]